MEGEGSVVIGDAGGGEWGREFTFSLLKNPKDRLILCLPEVASAEYDRADERDKPGWTLFNEGINKWLSKPAYSMGDKYDNGGQAPLLAQWDWLMRYARFRDTVEGMIDRVNPPHENMDKNYLFGPQGRQQLQKILEGEGAFDGSGQAFDHINLPWDKLRFHAFQSKPMDSRWFEWLAGTKPDGLAVIIGELVLLAVAKGYTSVNAGARRICVEAVGLFIHDGFEFQGDQSLGRWDCTNKEFSLFGGEPLANNNFREFRMRSGYGCDFRIMNTPELVSIERICYNALP